MPMKRESIKSPVVYIRHAETVCQDCGKLGCLIPVPHKLTHRSTKDE
jgi:hypothetical protein